MELICTIDNKYVDKFMRILLSGILQSLKEGAITIDESELLVFRPFISSLMQRNGCDGKLVHIIDLGCELEDIESQVPETFEAVIQSLMTKTSDYIHAKKDDYPMSDNVENIVSFTFRK
ncbi:DUF3969 family protein [Escherichia albertii]|uniref:DUF3969 family protein n=1 Tax=Escherichia albertii TaxID=208962 RepID=UPI0011316EDB|nr:DUF3969 family protein [Escherichia albertii]